MPWDHNHFENWYISLATLRYQAIQHDKFTGQKLHGRRSHQTIMYGIWWWCVNFMMTNNYCHLFKFSDIIEQSQKLFLYSSTSIQRMQHLKKAMQNVKEVTWLGCVAARMMDKYLGDRTGFIEVSNHYGLLLKEHNFTAQTKTYKDTPISTKQFTESCICQILNSIRWLYQEFDW